MNDAETTKSQHAACTRDAVSAATEQSSADSREAESLELAFLEEVCVEEVSIDGMCGVY